MRADARQQVARPVTREPWRRNASLPEDNPGGALPGSAIRVSAALSAQRIVRSTLMPPDGIDDLKTDEIGHVATPCEIARNDQPQGAIRPLRTKLSGGISIGN